MDFDDLDDAEADAQAEAAEEAGEALGSSSYAAFMNQYMADLMAGKLTFQAPGRPADLSGARADRDLEALRAKAEASRASLEQGGVAPLPPFRRVTMQDLEKTTYTIMNGEMYGLPVPPNLDDLRRRGARYLTQIFKAAGTIKDNAVAKVLEFKRLPMTGRDAEGGSGPKAFITVEWEKEDPELHTELFCKMPWDMGKEPAKVMSGETPTPEEQERFFKQKEKGIDPYYRWKCSGQMDMEGQECTIYRFLGPIFPFKTPKYYFADICRGNTNYILVTEKIPFPKKGQVPKEAYKIQPVAQKYFDFNLEPRMQHEMYFALMRAQARLAAWDKLGFFNVTPPEMRGVASAPPPLGAFEWPPKLPEKKRAVKVKGGERTAGMWREYLGDKAKALYDPQYSEPGFLAAICACCEEVQGYKDDLFMYDCLFPDMIALQHMNLQSDNAYYWYNADGQMDAGLIDWGGACPGHFCQRLTGSITSALGSVLDEHEDGLLQCFIDEYYYECGIKLDFEDFRRHWWLNYCTYVISMGMNIEMEIFRETPREMWAGIEDIWDDKVAGRWNVRCFAFMIKHALEYLHLRWKRKGGGTLHVLDAFREWKVFWEARGLT